MVGWQVGVDLGPDNDVAARDLDRRDDGCRHHRAGADRVRLNNGLQVLREPEGVVAACQLTTPEKIAATAGFDAKLTIADCETACTFEGGKGDRHIMISVAMQDPATFAMAIEGLGGAEVDGPGERSWWMADYDTFATQQGDLALQVTVTPDKETNRSSIRWSLPSWGSSLRCDSRERRVCLVFFVGRVPERRRCRPVGAGQLEFQSFDPLLQANHAIGHEIEKQAREGEPCIGCQ